jgi:hypothetical protein
MMKSSLATIPNTEVRSLSSAIVDQVYRIYIALPFDYQTVNDHYPVLYISDANAMFGTVTETIRMLQMFQEVPEMVIVGIGYPVNDFRQTLGLRARDLTPTEDDAWNEGVKNLTHGDYEIDGTGGAANFLRFIREELKPYIESNYRIQTEDSTILGHSFGGLFGLYALLQAPDTFRRYVLSSPSIWWDRQALFEYEEAYASKHHDLPATVFISAGTLEESMLVPVRGVPARFVTNVNDMASKLHDRGYENLALTHHVFEDENHFSGGPGAISRGLRVVFSS